MAILTLWKQSLRLVSHAYFERKDHFELDQDTYPTWVLFALESGKFRYQIGEECGEANAGDLIYCPPGYTFYREMVKPLELHYIDFSFTDNTPQGIDTLLPSFKAYAIDSTRLASNFAYLRKLHIPVNPRSEWRKQLILNDIWQLSCEVWEGDHQQDELAQLANSEDTLMNRAADWLYRHAHTPFAMSDLSDTLGLSRVQFSRRFRKAFHMTPSDFVRSLRIRKATELLLDTDLTLHQIASHCGYENGYYLSRVFTEVMGMRPSKFREKNRI